MAQVKWKTIYKSKEEGDLRIKDINSFNIALQGKRKWRLGTEE